MADENNLLNAEDPTLTNEQKKKAINLQDLIYVKQYIKKYVAEAVADIKKQFTDGTAIAKNATNASLAEKATCDEDGINIKENYVKSNGVVETANTTDFTNSGWTNVREDGLDTTELISRATYEIIFPYDSSRRFGNPTGKIINGGNVCLIEYNGFGTQGILNVEFDTYKATDPVSTNLSSYVRSMYVTRCKIVAVNGVNRLKVLVEKIDLVNPDGLEALFDDGYTGSDKTHISTIEGVRHPYEVMYYAFAYRRIR